MKLIRPFDDSTDILAIIENDEWIFEVVVGKKDPDAKILEIFYLDVPVLDNGSKQNATVVINEKYLLGLTHALNHLDHPLLGIVDESTFGPDEGGASTVRKLKRRAVSIALEETMDYIESFVSNT